MVGADFGGAASRFARVVGAVQCAPASTTVSANLRRQFMVDAQQQREKLRVVQEGVTHWDGP